MQPLTHFPISDLISMFSFDYTILNGAASILQKGNCLRIYVFQIILAK